jgi:hypothetical protein
MAPQNEQRARLAARIAFWVILLTPTVIAGLLLVIFAGLSGLALAAWCGIAVFVLASGVFLGRLLYRHFGAMRRR